MSLKMLYIFDGICARVTAVPHSCVTMLKISIVEDILYNHYHCIACFEFDALLENRCSNDPKTCDRNYGHRLLLGSMLLLCFIYLPDLPAIEADVEAPSHACEFSISFACCRIQIN